MATRIRIPLRERRPNHLAMQRTLMNNSYSVSEHLTQVLWTLPGDCLLNGLSGVLYFILLLLIFILLLLLFIIYIIIVVVVVSF